MGEQDEDEDQKYQHGGSVLQVVVQLPNDSSQPEKPYNFQCAEQGADTLVHVTSAFG